MGKSLKKSIWVFGDYRNYFQNRVTLQLLAKAKELAKTIQSDVCALVFGNHTEEYVNEYIAHGADTVYVMEHESLTYYNTEKYSLLVSQLAKDYHPEIILIGSTTFGREVAPRIAKRLHTGLTADCIKLSINKDGLLVQTAPAFGGNLLAEIITPDHRPQIATVRPGMFQELPHDYERKGNIVKLPLPANMPIDRIRTIQCERQDKREQRIENANVVICGGRGMGSKQKFKKLFELASLLHAEVGATRPVVYANWIDHDSLVGQAGKHIKPKILFSFGISGAIQHTAAINDADLIIAVNKNPNAMMMKIADIAIVADASQFATTLIKSLKKRLRA